MAHHACARTRRHDYRPRFAKQVELRARNRLRLLRIPAAVRRLPAATLRTREVDRQPLAFEQLHRIEPGLRHEHIHEEGREQIDVVGPRRGIVPVVHGERSVLHAAVPYSYWPQHRSAHNPSFLAWVQIGWTTTHKHTRWRGSDESARHAH